MYITPDMTRMRRLSAGAAGRRSRAPPLHDQEIVDGEDGLTFHVPERGTRGMANWRLLFMSTGLIKVPSSVCAYKGLTFRRHSSRGARKAAWALHAATIADQTDGRMRGARGGPNGPTEASRTSRTAASPSGAGVSPGGVTRRDMEPHRGPERSHALSGGALREK